MKKENWQKQLKNEFGIHFKDSPDELQFLEAFIEDLLETQKQKHQKELTTQIQKLKGIDKYVLEEILNLLKEK